MRPGLDRIVQEMTDAILHDVPEYARPLDGTYTQMVRRAVSHSVKQFVERIANPATPREPTAAVFRDIGRVEAAAGRSLEPLQTALRLGARVAWRQLYVMYERDRRLRHDIDALARLGEAIFLYLDELAAACADGYAQARAEVAGELERRRRRLLDLVVADPPASPAAIADLARAAAWRLPRRVAAVALEDRGDDRFLPLPSLPAEVLIDMTRRDPCLLVPDPDGPGRAQLIERGLRGWAAAVGPAVPLARASSSLRWARQALALAQRGMIVWSNRVVCSDDHMATLLILSDEELVRTLAAKQLAPIRRLRPGQQDRLAETLLAWLQNAGNAKEVARRLHVHPQTVRYRLRQLNELFGDQLRDPDARFELEIALRSRRLLSAESSPPAAAASAPRSPAASAPGSPAASAPRSPEPPAGARDAASPRPVAVK
jgi:PucR C-terminal helix-turn-helix domain